MEIKPYKPMIIIYYKDIDWSIGALQTEAQNELEIREDREKKKSLHIEWVTLSTYLIQKIEKPKNDLEEIFYSQPRPFRQYMNRKAIKRGFVDYLSELQSVQNPLAKLESAIKSFNL
mgnify:CR=1 FL=1